MDAVFKELRRDKLIALGQWLQRVSVNEVVELENRAVDAFPRVFFRCRLSGERRQQQAGTYT
ncbi:hypothetical protein D3C81_1849920 [compost metagenome]